MDPDEIEDVRVRRESQAGVSIIYVCRGCNIFSSTSQRAVSAHFGHKCKLKYRREHPYDRGYSAVQIRIGDQDKEAGGQSRPANGGRSKSTRQFFESESEAEDLESPALMASESQIEGVF